MGGFQKSENYRLKWGPERATGRLTEGTRSGWIPYIKTMLTVAQPKLYTKEFIVTMWWSWWDFVPWALFWIFVKWETPLRPPKAFIDRISLRRRMAFAGIEHVRPPTLQRHFVLSYSGGHCERCIIRTALDEKNPNKNPTVVDGKRQTSPIRD